MSEILSAEQKFRKSSSLMLLFNDFTIIKRKFLLLSANQCFKGLVYTLIPASTRIPAVSAVRSEHEHEQLVRCSFVWPLTLVVWAGYWGCSRKPKGDTLTLSKPLRFVLLIFSWSADWLLRANHWGINPLYLSSCASFIVLEMQPGVLFWILTGLCQHRGFLSAPIRPVQTEAASVRNRLVSPVDTEQPLEHTRHARRCCRWKRKCFGRVGNITALFLTPDLDTPTDNSFDLGHFFSA